MFDTALTAADLVFLAKGAGMTLLVTAIAVVLGTILMEPVLLALRRLAQADASVKRFG